MIESPSVTLSPRNRQASESVESSDLEHWLSIAFTIYTQDSSSTPYLPSERVKSVQTHECGTTYLLC